MSGEGCLALHPVLVSQAGKLAVERGWAINVGECPAQGSWPVKAWVLGGPKRTWRKQL